MPFSNNVQMKKIFLQNRILSEGDLLAHQGKYEEAIAKFNEAMNPECINNNRDKAAPQLKIITAYKRQGNFRLALKEHTELFYNKYSNHELTINEHLGLLALVKFMETKDSKPVEDHISYLKHKYAKQLPPNGYLSSFSGIVINDLIHLYDYIRDYNAGTAFMEEVIKYLIKDGYAESLGGKKTINEYMRVKQAWELDKKTGKHGHLQEVIKTSDIISW
jgi:tetratricopeptide (TPR) repeat protein